jgi:hydrogenase maturation factor
MDVLRCVKRTSQVIVPPMPGFDSGAHKICGDNCMVVSTDPCIGVPEKWFGWFLIHFAASDVAAFGAPPQYGTINLLGPPNTGKTVFEKVMQQACEAADALKMTIITGHTGTYDKVSVLIGVCTAYGIIKRRQLITPAGAKPGDHLICTKPVGLETVVNFALIHEKLADNLFGHGEAASLRMKVTMETCVDEALLLAKTGGVTAMHDATEGGLVAALNEMAEASKVGFSVDFGRLPVPSQLNRLAERFDLTRSELLSASSTGTLLAAVSPSHSARAMRTLAKIGLQAKKVGVFSRSKSRILRLNGSEVRFPEEASDPYARIMFSVSQI